MAVIMFDVSTNVAPNKLRPTMIGLLGVQRYCGGTHWHGVIIERSSGPRCNQSTPGDKNEIFHALHAHVVAPRPGKPADYIISYVVLERFRADGVFVVASVRKRQKCTTTSSFAFIRSTFGPDKVPMRRDKRIEAVRETIMTHSSGVSD